MKRFLSWLVLWGGEYLFSFLIAKIISFVVYVLAKLYLLNGFVMWIILILVGSSCIFALLSLPLVAGISLAALSQKISPSRKGYRYVVYGVIEIPYRILMLIFAFIGIVMNAGLAFYLVMVICLIFNVAVTILGTKSSKEM